MQQVLGTVAEMAQGQQLEQFQVNKGDFLSARESGQTAGTQIVQRAASMDDVAEIVNQSFPKREPTGEYTNVICPVVIPKGHRSLLWVFVFISLGVLGLTGLVSTAIVDGTLGLTTLSTILFGPHYWLLLLLYAGFNIWRNSFVMIPDGCKALVTQFGKLENISEAGRTWLFNPWKRISYVVNVTKEYPYNAPIREAPTASRVNASVDLFLQFRIEDPAEFIFTLGGVKGFSEKLENAISEVTRALIYEQKAETIYDLVGETTQSLLDTLNQQFLPAVRFVNANITHAEPSSQEYRMDLASPEMVRVAKEAYTYEYEIKLRKEQDEGDLNKELAKLRETLSEIRADIATYQAQMDTAREREVHRANSYAQQRLIEAESEAKANAALLEAQALDLRSMSGASFPEILEYRFEQDTLDKLEAVADQLPHVMTVGSSTDQHIDYMAIARQMMGIRDEALYTPEDMQAIRERMNELTARIKERSGRIRQLMEEAKIDTGEEVTA